MPLTDAFNLFLIFALPTISGIFIILSLNRTYRLPLPFLVSLGYGLGMGMVAQWLLILGIFHQSFDLIVVNFPFYVIPLLLFRRVILKRYTPPSHMIHASPKQKIDPYLNSLLLSFIICLVFIIFWRALNVPIMDWDAVSTESFRGKIFYYAQSLEYYAKTPHPTYPLHIPLLQTWLSFNWGAWNEQYIKIFQPLYSLAFLLLSFSFLRNFCSKTWSLLGVALILSSNLYVYHSAGSYRDLSLLYYNCSATLLLILWQSKGDRMLLLLAGLFSGFASFVKVEGTGLLLAQSSLLILILFFGRTGSAREKWKQFGLFIIPAGVICLTYLLYQSAQEQVIVEPLTHPGLHQIQLGVSDLPRKIWVVAISSIENMFLSFNWNILFLLLSLSLLNFEGLKRQSAARWLLLAFCLNFGLYFAIFTLTQFHYWISETNAAHSRTLLHFFPLACLLVVLINFREKESQED